VVVDWDNAENEAEDEWQRFDDEDRKYIETKFPNEFEKFFAKFRLGVASDELQSFSGDARAPASRYRRSIRSGPFSNPFLSEIKT
jgi:hypothetical protein